MKKILFMLINMNIGGTEKAFLNMLGEIPLDQYEITVLMLEEYGGFLNQLPQGIKIKYLPGFEQLKGVLNRPLYKVFQDLISKQNYKEGIKVLLIYIICKLTKERSSLFRYALKNMKELDEVYDLAVAYAGPMEFITYFVRHKVKAIKKVQWIHFDIEKINFNAKFAKRHYKRFDKIFVVSEEGKNKLVKSIPQLKDKIDIFLNRVSPERLRKSSEENGFEDHYEGIRVLTVGRIAEEKGQDLCIEACKRLKEEGYNFRWYSIGDGRYRVECEKLIERYGLQKEFIFLGAKTNPYPYMKEADLYVQSSRHEGYCITLAEAKIFHKPIVTTCFTGANEQIQEGETGIIVEINSEAIYTGIKRLLDYPALRKQMSDNLSRADIANKESMKKLYQLIQ